MRLKAILIAALMVCGVSTVSAQTEKGLRYGVTAGLNCSNFSEGDMDSRIGFHVGVRGEYNFTNSLYGTASLLFSQKGAKFDEDGYKVKENPGYLELPVMVGYRYGFDNGLSIFGETGPYFAYGICGKAKFGDAKVDFFEDGVKKFDAGWGINVGVEYSKFQIRVGYEFGLSKIYDEGDAKNRNLTVGVAYMF